MTKEQIEQIAIDESQKHDWDSLKYREIWVDGFVAGAATIFSKKGLVVVYKDGSSIKVDNSYEYENDENWLTTISI